MRLNFGGNLTAAMARFNGRGDVVCRGIQLPRSPCLDLRPQNSSLTISDSWNTRRRGAALRRHRLDRHARKPGILQFTADHGHIMITMRGTGHEARRIIGEQACQGVRHIIREVVFLDAIPDVE
ncbi:hypothetical protein D3C87_1013490 [compost metagenome]